MFSLEKYIIENRGGFRNLLRGVRDFAREALAIFFRTPLSNFRTPLRASQGGAKIAQGGAKNRARLWCAKSRTPLSKFLKLPLSMTMHLEDTIDLSAC